METAALKEKFTDLVQEHLRVILKDVANSFAVSFEELEKKYLTNTAKDDNKKRGRKKKPKEEFIEVEEYEYEGKMYLVDNQNNIYSHNVSAPQRMGERLADGSIHFMTDAQTPTSGTV